MGYFMRCCCAFVLTLAAGAVVAQAAVSESMTVGARNLFLGAAGAAAPRFAHGADVSDFHGAPSVMPRGEPQLREGKFPFSVMRLAAVSDILIPRMPSKEVALQVLLNRHLKTTLAFTMGGKSVWISGAFDRAQKAYVSVLEQDKIARFFNVEELLRHPVVIDIGTGKFKLSLSPDLVDQLESEIVLTNIANRRDQQRITLREMLGAVSAAGEEVLLAGSAYRLFYYDDIKDGQGDPSSRSFAFILTDKGEISVFLVPVELVPGNKIAVFKMKDNKTMGLQRVGETLRVFDNP